MNGEANFPEGAKLQEAALAEHTLNTQIKLDMENFQIAFRANSVKEAEVVLNVLKDIEDQNQIEKRALFPRDVGQFELKPFEDSCPGMSHPCTCSAWTFF